MATNEPKVNNTQPTMQLPSLDQDPQLLGSTNQAQLMSQMSTQSHMPGIDFQQNNNLVTTVNSSIGSSLSIEKDKNYLVRLPHSKYQFTVRGLLVEEEDAIKSSSDGAKNIITKLMKILYDCVSSDVKTADHPFGKFETFMSSISLEDRDTLIFAVIAQTYENDHDMYIRCNRCGEGFTETISLNSILNFEYYNGQDPIMNRREILELPEHQWKIYLKIPTVADEMRTINSNPNVKDMQRAAEYLFIDKIEYVHHEGGIAKAGKKDVTNNYVEIYGLLKKKPALIRKKIEKAYRSLNTNNTTEKEYGVTARYTTSCKNCGSQITVNVVPISHLLFLVQ